MSVRIQKDNKQHSQLRVDIRWPDGSRFRRNFPNKVQANEVNAKIIVARRDGTWRKLRDDLAKGTQAQRVTLAEFADRYLEEYCKVHNRAWQRKRDTVKALNLKLGHVELESIDANMVAKFVSWRKEQGRSNGTINRDLAHLKHMMNYAVKLELIKENRIARVDRLKEIVRCRPTFTDEQVDHFLSVADPRIRPMFGFMRETGCRLTEAMTIKQTQVLRDKGIVIFTDETKSGKFRVVPMTEECRRWIDEIPPLPGCPWVFFNPRSRTRWKCARKIIDKAIAASGLDGFLLKDLRRHYGITLSENGAEMHVIQSMLGHSSVVTTETFYANFSPNFAARRALQVLEGRKQENRGTKTGRQDESNKVA